MSPRVLVQELPSGRILDWAAPLTGAAPTTTLSGPGALTGDLPAGYTVPVAEWGTALWVEDDGVFLGGGIVEHVDDKGDARTVTCVGVSGYPKKLPWLAPREDLIKVDPLVVVRKIWTHLQSIPDGDLHVEVDATTSPVRVGEPERTVEFQTKTGDDVSFEAGPYRLNPIDAQDLQKCIDDLAADTPFDYREHTFWVGEQIRHRIELGYPSLGATRSELRFVIGENIAVLPALGFESDAYASEVLVVGAGEGRAAVTAHVPSAKTTRLRRVAIVADKTLTTQTAATNRAREELAARDPRGVLSDITVIDHPNAPRGSFDVGDTIHITGQLYNGTNVDHWARITDITRPLDSDRATLTLIPATV